MSDTRYQIHTPRMLSLAAKLLFISLPAASCATMLPGMSFLGHGYNILVGNPIDGGAGSGVPEGLAVVQRVFSLTANPSDSLSWNGGTYSCATGVECNLYNACSENSQSYSAFGAKSYQEALGSTLGVGASGGVKGFKGSFTASTSFQLTVEGMEEHRYHYQFVQATCQMFGLRMLKFSDASQLTPEFVKAISSLPVPADGEDEDKYLNPYYTVISSFGTHFTTAIRIGGQMFRSTWMTEVRRNCHCEDT